MIKLNKARTLYQFDQSILGGDQQQQSEQTSQKQEESKQEQNKTITTNDKKEKSDKLESNKEKGNKDEESKGLDASSDKQASNNNQNNESNAEAQNQENKNENKAGDNKEAENSQMTYLFFGPDEFVITTFKNENGWWYGYKDLGDDNQKIKFGYFPSNYVQVIEEYAVPEYNEADDEQKANANMDEAFTWSDYASHSYLNDNQILVDERMRKLNDVNDPTNKNPEGILGYKKIKIHESRSHAVNSWKGGKVMSGQIAIKDQSQVGKAYRQMHHYFDYDAWNEQQNSNPTAKAKADPSKKKEKKKVLNW